MMSHQNTTSNDEFISRDWNIRRNVTHKYFNDGNPVNTPSAIVVISLPKSDLTKKHFCLYKQLINLYLFSLNNCFPFAYYLQVL